MQKLNTTNYILITIISIVIFSFLLFTIPNKAQCQDEADCFSPDVELEIDVNSLIVGDNYKLEDIRIQIANNLSFADDTMIGDKLKVNNLEVADKGLKPTSDVITIFVSGREECPYYIRGLIVDNGGNTIETFAETHINMIIPYPEKPENEEPEEIIVTIDVDGIPDGETKKQVITAEVEGDNLEKYKYRLNGNEWSKELTRMKIDIEFDSAGPYEIEFIGIGPNGELSDIWSKNFSIIFEKLPDFQVYPLYLGGQGYEIILNYYYYVAISHYAEYEKLKKEGKKKEAFEAQKLAHAYYNWAEYIEDEISPSFEYRLPTTENIEKKYIAGEGPFSYTNPRFYSLVKILDKLIDTYINSAYTATYRNNLESAINYYEIVLLLDPYNEIALRELDALTNGSYKPDYNQVFTEERDPRLVEIKKDDNEEDDESDDDDDEVNGFDDYYNDGSSNNNENEVNS